MSIKLSLMVQHLSKSHGYTPTNFRTLSSLGILHHLCIAVNYREAFLDAGLLDFCLDSGVIAEYTIARIMDDPKTMSKSLRNGNTDKLENQLSQKMMRWRPLLCALHPPQRYSLYTDSNYEPCTHLR